MGRRRHRTRLQAKIIECRGTHGARCQDNSPVGAHHPLPDPQLPCMHPSRNRTARCLIVTLVVHRAEGHSCRSLRHLAGLCGSLSARKRARSIRYRRTLRRLGSKPKRDLSRGATARREIFRATRRSTRAARVRQPEFRPALRLRGDQYDVGRAFL